MSDLKLIHLTQSPFENDVIYFESQTPLALAQKVNRWLIPGDFFSWSFPDKQYLKKAFKDSLKSDSFKETGLKRLEAWVKIEKNWTDQIFCIDYSDYKPSAGKIEAFLQEQDWVQKIAYIDNQLIRKWAENLYNNFENYNKSQNLHRPGLKNSPLQFSKSKPKGKPIIDHAVFDRTQIIETYTHQNIQKHDLYRAWLKPSQVETIEQLFKNKPKICFDHMLPDYQSEHQVDFPWAYQLSQEETVYFFPKSIPVENSSIVLKLQLNLSDRNINDLVHGINISLEKQNGFNLTESEKYNFTKMLGQEFKSPVFSADDFYSLNFIDCFRDWVAGRIKLWIESESTDLKWLRKSTDLEAWILKNAFKPYKITIEAHRQINESQHTNLSCMQNQVLIKTTNLEQTLQKFNWGKIQKAQIQQGRINPQLDHQEDQDGLKLPPDKFIIHSLTGTKGTPEAYTRLKDIVNSPGLLSNFERRTRGIKVKTLSPIGDAASGIDDGVACTIWNKPMFDSSVIFVIKPKVLSYQNIWFAPKDFGACGNRYTKFEEYANKIGYSNFRSGAPISARINHLKTLKEDNELYVKHMITWADIQAVIVRSDIDQCIKQDQEFQRIIKEKNIPVIPYHKSVQASLKKHKQPKSQANEVVQESVKLEQKEQKIEHSANNKKQSWLSKLKLKSASCK